MQRTGESLVNDKRPPCGTRPRRCRDDESEKHEAGQGKEARDEDSEKLMEEKLERGRKTRQGRERKVGIGKRRLLSPRRLHIGGDGKIKQQRATPTLLNIAFTAVVAARRVAAPRMKAGVRRKVGRAGTTCPRYENNVRVPAYRGTADWRVRLDRIYRKCMHARSFMEDRNDRGSYAESEGIAVPRKKLREVSKTRTSPLGIRRGVCRGGGAGGRSYCCHTYWSPMRRPEIRRLDGIDKDDFDRTGFRRRYCFLSFSLFSMRVYFYPAEK